MISVVKGGRIADRRHSIGAREVSLILVAAALKVFNNYISIHCLYNCEGEGRRNIYKRERERERFSSRDAEWLVVQKKASLTDQHQQHK